MIGVPWASSAQMKLTIVAAHSLVTDPDISLDVLQHMAEVD